MQPHQVKAKLKRGEAVFGSFVYIPSPRLTELIALSGFDFVVIDQEHGPITIESAEPMVQACEVTGCTPIVRVPYLQSHAILQALDIGAMGIHVPNVSNSADAKKAVGYSKYAPAGNRGLAAVRAARYGLREKLSEYCERANEEVLVAIHIEDLEAIQNLDDLLSVEGVDVYYLGPTDISNSMGQPGLLDTKVQKVVDGAIEKIVKAGRIAGMITTSQEAARRYLDMGVRYLATHALHFMVAGSQTFLNKLKG